MRSWTRALAAACIGWAVAILPAHALTNEAALAMASGTSSERIEAITAAVIEAVEKGDDKTEAFLKAMADDSVRYTADKVFVMQGDKGVDPVTGAEVPVPFKAKVSLDVGPDLDFPDRVPQGPVRARLIQDPRQSPDGKRLAFTALDRVWVMDYPSGRPRRISSAGAGEHHPAWSPDGRYLAYVTWSDAEGGHATRDAGRTTSGEDAPRRRTRRSARSPVPEAFERSKDQWINLNG